LGASALDKAKAGQNEVVKRNAANERLGAFVWGGEALCSEAELCCNRMNCGWKKQMPLKVK